MDKFKIGSRVSICSGDVRIIGTVTKVYDNPICGLRDGYPTKVCDVRWDGEDNDTCGYLSFLLDLYVEGAVAAPCQSIEAPRH